MLFTAAYVHAGVDHLLGNILGYLLAASYTYWLCLQFERRRWFWRTTLALLLVVPIFVNVANLLIFGTYVPKVEGYSCGFSGVVGAFGGFLFVAFVLAVRDVYDGAAAQVVGVSLFLLLLLMLDFVYAGTLKPLVGGAVAFGIGAQVVGVLYERNWHLPTIKASTGVLAVRGVSGLLVVAVVALLVFALFPAQPVQGGALVNIFGHGIGFITGGVGAFVLLFW